MPDSSPTRISQALEVGSGQFRVDGEPIAIYSGAVHYWRLERDKWDDILDKVKGMGFNTISSYIPWEIHEIKRGEFDFGQIDPRKDIDAFITLVESKGMRMIVRPGPQINSELTWFGYPCRILDDPELQAKSAMGSKAVLTQVPRPIPAVNYASEKFFVETALWYDAICAILSKHVYPKGGIVAAQVDNEMAFFFHINPYACDFSDDSIRAYQAFLKEKYENLETLSAVYGRGYDGFDKVDPPRRFEGTKKEDIPYYTDWIEYRERYLVNSLSRLADMLKERGLQDLSLFHNYPHPLGPGGAASGITTPFNLLALEDKLDFVGFDIYSRKELYDHVKTVVSYVVGTSRFPFIPEFIAGVWPWYLNPGGAEDEEFVTKAALMHGIKGFSRYMIVERDRWFGSPVRRDGRIREENYNIFRRVNEIALKYDFLGKRRQADILLLANREYDRLEAASVLVTFPGDFLEILLGFSEYPNFMTVSEKDFGFSEPIQIAKANWFKKMYAGLTTSGYQFLLSDTSLPLERLSKYKVLVLGSFDFMNHPLQEKIVAYAGQGGTVILGPKVPVLDERMQKDLTLQSALKEETSKPVMDGSLTIGQEYPVGKGKVILFNDLQNADAYLKAAVNGRGLVQILKNDNRFDVTIHRSSDNSDQMILFVCNPTAQAIQAKVELNVAVKSMHDLWNDRAVQTDGKSFSALLPAYKIMIYECKL